MVMGTDKHSVFSNTHNHRGCSRMNDIEVLHDAVFGLPAGFTVEQYIDKNVAYG